MLSIGIIRSEISSGVAPFLDSYKSKYICGWETAFSWEGPAMIEVVGTDSFELMTKLTSQSGLISNTNCARENQVHNISGYDRPDVAYVRFINIGETPIKNVRGSLYDSQGNVIGNPGVIIIEKLSPKAQIWKSRDRLSDLIGDTWNGLASLKIVNAH